MKRFNQKVAAITGAGSGIGRHLAIALAQQGCHLSLSDINQASLIETVQQLEDYQVRVTSQMVNVANLLEVRDWATNTVRDHGHVNMIFNNAGVALASTFEGASYEELQWIMDINLWGVIYGTKEFLPYIKQTQDGHIINISSLFGLISQPTQSAYNLTKFAIRGLTESLRQELEIENCNVGVTCVHPGGIKTNIAKVARINDSLKTLGVDIDGTSNNFDQLLRTSAQDAAQQILVAVKKNKRRVLIGSDAKVLDMVQRIFPASYQRLAVMLFKFTKKK